MQGAADAAIERNLAATNGVDDDAGRIRRVFHGQFQIDFHWHITEHATFHPNKADFIIALPRDVVARADVNVFIGQSFTHDRLHRLGFGSLLRDQARPVQHIQKIGVAAGI